MQHLKGMGAADYATDPNKWRYDISKKDNSTLRSYKEKMPGRDDIIAQEFDRKYVLMDSVFTMQDIVTNTIFPSKKGFKGPIRT